MTDTPKPHKPARTPAERARSELLALFSRGQLDTFAHDARIPNPTLMNRPELETYLIARWPGPAIRDRLLALLIRAEGP